MLHVTWPVERTRLVGQALLRRAATAALGQQLLDEGGGGGSDDLYVLDLDWAEASCTAARRTLEGEIGRLYAAIGRAEQAGQSADALVREQSAIYAAMQDLKAWIRVSR